MSNPFSNKKTRKRRAENPFGSYKTSKRRSPKRKKQRSDRSFERRQQRVRKTRQSKAQGFGNQSVQTSTLRFRDQDGAIAFEIPYQTNYYDSLKATNVEAIAVAGALFSAFQWGQDDPQLWDEVERLIGGSEQLRSLRTELGDRFSATLHGITPIHKDEGLPHWTTHLDLVDRNDFSVQMSDSYFEKVEML